MDRTHSAPIDGSSVSVGARAPVFDLPVVQGGRFSLSTECRQANVLVWFSRGFQCNFCRSHMQEFARGFEQLKEKGTTMVQIAPNLESSARKFFRTGVPLFPFVCDPDKRLYAVYGLGDRGAIDAAKNAIVTFSNALRTGETLRTARGAYLDIVNRNFVRRLHHHAATALEHGLFLVDRAGVIQERIVVGPVDPVPTVPELLKVIASRCPDAGGESTQQGEAGG